MKTRLFCSLVVGSTAVSAPVSLTAQAIDSIAALDSTSPIPPADSLLTEFSLPPQVVGYLAALTDSFPDTPLRMGLLPTGMVEAEIASVYVRIAGRDSADVRNMTRNMRHVIHAIDPDLVDGGLGLGYGFKRAVEGVRTYTQLAASTPGASEALLYHAPFIDGATTSALSRADDALALARQIETSQAEPQEILERLEDLGEMIRGMAFGSDRDRDGRIGNDASESGLAQAQYHLALIRSVAGLAPAPPLPASLPIPVFVRDPTGVGR